MVEKVTCKECLFLGICKYNSNPTGEEEICEVFADKALFVKLPCKVGDTVYIFNRSQDRVQKMFFDKPDIRCHCALEDNLCMATCSDKSNGICAYRFKNDFSEMGKTVFLTYKEAEKALKEKENGR